MNLVLYPKTSSGFRKGHTVLINNNTFYFGLLKINRTFGRVLLLQRPVSHLPWQSDRHVSGKQSSQWVPLLPPPLLLVFKANNAAGNINDILYPQQRWKESSKLVMGLTIWSSHTELISFASRHSKSRALFFPPNFIPFCSPRSLQSFKTLIF